MPSAECHAKHRHHFYGFGFCSLYIFSSGNGCISAGIVNVPHGRVHPLSCPPCPPDSHRLTLCSFLELSLFEGYFTLSHILLFQETSSSLDKFLFCSNHTTLEGRYFVFSYFFQILMSLDVVTQSRSKYETLYFIFRADDVRRGGRWNAFL